MSLDLLEDSEAESAEVLISPSGGSSSSQNGGRQGASIETPTNSVPQPIWSAQPLSQIPVVMVIPVIPCMLAIQMNAPPSNQVAAAPLSGNEAAAGQDYNVNASMATPSTRRPWRRFPVHPMPALSEEEWQTRIDKRRSAIDLIMKTAEYKSYDASGRQPPSAPDALDRSMSKRAWELQVKKFRDAVKARAVPFEMPGPTLLQSISSVGMASAAARPENAKIFGSIKGRPWADICAEDPDTLC
jgi:hypothetical protein